VTSDAGFERSVLLSVPELPLITAVRA